MKEIIVTYAKRDFTIEALELGIWEQLREMVQEETGGMPDDDDEITLHISKAYV